MVYRRFNGKRKRSGAKVSKRNARRPRSMATKSLVSLIKKVSINQTQEKKWAGYTYTNGTLYHDTPVLLDQNPFYLYQGVADNDSVSPLNRIGDEIFSKNLNVRMMIYNLLNHTGGQYHPNIIYRLTVCKVEPSATLPSTPYVAVGGTGNNILNRLDTEASWFRGIVFDNVYTKLWADVPNSQDIATSNQSCKFMKYYVPVNKKLKYKDAGTSPTNFQVAMWLTAFDQLNTVIGSTQIGSFAYSRVHTFHDA